jgi:hypothetical protein
MRLPFSSVLFATAAAASLSSPAHASTVYAEPNPSARADLFSLKFGAGSSGTVIFDGYRTLDGRNFYVDYSSSNNRPSFSGAFSFAGGSDSRAVGSTSSGPSNNGTGIGLGGGKGNLSFNFGGGMGSSNFSFDGAKGSGSFGGVSLKGSNPLAFLASLDENRTGASSLGGGDPVMNASATPLPPTWTMMLIGLGCFGLVTQRLRSKTEKEFAAA